MLQPFDELLHLIHEDSPALGCVAIFVPLENHLLGEHLSLVEQQDDLVEALQEVLIVVTELLNLQRERCLAPMISAAARFFTLLQRTSSLRALVVKILKSEMYSLRCFRAWNLCMNYMLAKQALELDLLLQKIFLLIPLAGGHDRRPDHADRLWLGQAVLLHVLPQLGDDLLLALALGDAVLQVPLKLLDLFGEN